MTPHMRDLVADLVGYEVGPVLEIGSYIEANQDHLDLRRVLPRATSYVGIDVNAGPGVDQVADFLNSAQLAAVLERVTPRVTLCLYVVEHVWNIHAAAKALADIWNRSPESWLFVATHQNQPFHGTEKYGDFWRLTLSGFTRLMDEAGVPGSHVFALADTSNPADIVVVKQPASHKRAVVPAPCWERYR